MSKRKRKGDRMLARTPNPELAYDEYDNPQYEPGNPVSIRKVTVAVSLRNDAFGQMYFRGQLGPVGPRTDKSEAWARYRAGRQVQDDYELSGQGRIPGQDTTREPVDGGGIHAKGVTDRQMHAYDRLLLWESLLDAKGWQLCKTVLIDKRSLREACQAVYQTVSKAKLTYAGHRFREALDTLAQRMGLATS